MADDERVWVAAPRAGSVVALDAVTGEPTGSPVRTGGAPARLALGRSGVGGRRRRRDRQRRAAAARVRPVRLGPTPPTSRSPAVPWDGQLADGGVYAHDARGTTRSSVGRSLVALASDGKQVFVADSRPAR